MTAIIVATITNGRIIHEGNSGTEGEGVTPISELNLASQTLLPTVGLHYTLLESTENNGLKVPAIAYPPSLVITTEEA